MTKIADGLKQAIEGDATVVDTGKLAEIAQQPAGTYTVGTGDPMQTGINALRDAGLDPLRLWSLKAPKDAGGVVSAVFLQATSEVVIMHQLTSGRYVLFEKSSIDAVAEGSSAALGGDE